MARKMIIAPIIFALIFAIGLCPSAQANILTNNFLASPRIIAMGGAYVAVADDANAVFLNPAGLGNSTNSDISTNYGCILADASQQSIIGSVELKEHGKIGFGYNVIGTYNIQLTDSSGNPAGTGDWFIKDIAASYGFQVYRWFLLGIKMHRVSIGTQLLNLEDEGQGYGMDVGILIKPYTNFSVGMLISDLYATKFERTSGINEYISRSVVLGVSYQPIEDKVLLAVDLRSENIEENGNIDSISIGSEFNAAGWLRLRFGYLFEKDNSSNYVGTGTAGLGIAFLDNFRFDYAWRRPNGIMFDSHYFSLGCKI